MDTYGDNKLFIGNPRFVMIGVIFLAVILFIYTKSNQSQQPPPNPAEMVVQPQYLVAGQSAGTPQDLVRQINDFNINNPQFNLPQYQEPPIVSTNMPAVYWPG